MKRLTSNSDDICTYDNGRLRSIDLAKLFVRSGGLDNPDHIGFGRLPLRLVTRPKPLDIDDLLKTLVLRSLSTRALVRWTGLSLATRTHGHSDTSRLERSAKPLRPAAIPDLNLGLPETASYRVERTRQTRSRLFDRSTFEHVGFMDVELPFGMPRFVNARTLKAMLGAGSDEVLFRKDGERWEVCPDSYPVDLRDAKQIFRLAEIQIYS